MVCELGLVCAGGHDPYANLALEKWLLDHAAPGRVVLYLWQNARTVVIGRNQSALAEVRVAELEAAGGRLARRHSGGGAVYHDLGNLNFTFVARREDFDVARQTEVVLAAVRACGVAAERTGRNDLVVAEGAGDVAAGAGAAPAGPAGKKGAAADEAPVAGRKFSGHAYYLGAEACYHHGTLMVDVDAADMGRYLRPPAQKLRAKGVASVRSRVANLVELAPGLTVRSLAEALVGAFGREYGLPVARLAAPGEPGGPDPVELAALTCEFASRAWVFGDGRDLGHVASGRFAWGGATLRYDLDRDIGDSHLCHGHIAECALDSDGLDADFLAGVPALLRGCAAEPVAVEGALLAAAGADPARAAMAHDLATLVDGSSGRGSSAPVPNDPKNGSSGPVPNDPPERRDA